MKATEDLLLSVFYLYPKRNVKVVHYNEKWAELFSEEKGRLKLVFGPEIIAVHHIGSTSIPDMAAKPIIDMLIEVRSIEAVSQYDTQMKSIGYTPKGETA